MKTHTLKLVLLSLADNASDQGECYPSIDTIARRCDLSRQCVLTQIETLRSDGFLEVKKGGGRSSNTYTVVVNGVDPSSQPRGPQQSTASTVVVNGVDPNHKEPSVQSSSNQELSKPPESQSEKPLPSEAQTPNGSPTPKGGSSEKVVKKSQKPPADPRHAEFIRLWCDTYKATYGDSYVFQGGQDGMSLSRLLKALPDATAEELVSMAKTAWLKRGPKFWNCEKSHQLSFFCTRYNAIKQELGMVKPQKDTKPGDVW